MVLTIQSMTLSKKEKKVAQNYEWLFVCYKVKKKMIKYSKNKKLWYN